MAASNVEEGVSAPADRVSEHEGNDARRVALEGEHHEIAGNLNLRGIVEGLRRPHAGRASHRAGIGDSTFELAHSGHVLVELAAIDRPELARQAGCIARDRVEHALAAVSYTHLRAHETPEHLV